MKHRGKMTDLRSKALSPVVATITLIVVVVAVSIAVAAWMGALTLPFVASDLESRVDARIYSSENNIGVLNEDGIFDVAVKNYANKTRTINIVINAGEHVLYNEAVAIEPLSSKNVNITQRLVFLGTWTIELYEGKKVVGGYSFVTELNEAEAEMRITQLDNIRLNTTLSIAAIIVSTLSVIVSITHVIYARKGSVKS